MRNPSTITGSNPVKCVFDGAEIGSTGVKMDVEFTEGERVIVAKLQVQMKITHH